MHSTILLLLISALICFLFFRKQKSVQRRTARVKCSFGSKKKIEHTSPYAHADPKVKVSTTYEHSTFIQMGDPLFRKESYFVVSPSDISMHYLGAASEQIGSRYRSHVRA